MRPTCWIDRQVYEGDVLTPADILKRRKVSGLRPHPSPVIVEADLPAYEVFDFLDDEVSNMSVLVVVAWRVASEAVVQRSDRHAVCRFVVGIICSDHVQGNSWILCGVGGGGNE